MNILDCIIYIYVHRYGIEYLYCIEFALIDIYIYICLARFWRCGIISSSINRILTSTGVHFESNYVSYLSVLFFGAQVKSGWQNS